jgi:hypothetical protein
VRKRPEIPEDVFFDTTPARGNGDPDEESPPESEPDPPAERDEAPAGDVLAKSMDGDSARTPIKVADYRREQERKAAERERRRREAELQREQEADEGPEDEPARVGRPPAQEGPKVAVTLYLTEPVAHLLEEVKFRLLTEYDVKTSKSAIADFAMRNGLGDLQAAADDLRRD